MATQARPVRMGWPGIGSLFAGIAALALLPVARPVALVAALAAATAAGFELVEVHRVRAREAVAGLALGVLAFLAAIVLAARETLDLTTLVHVFFNVGAVRNVWPALVRGLYNTMRLAVVAEVGGVVLGMLIALSYISQRRVLRFPAVVYVDLFRGTPLLLQIIFIGQALRFVGIRLDFFVAGAVALSLNSAAYVAEIFRAGIQSVERGQMEAARGLGMPHRTAMRYVVVPQAVRRVIPPLMNEFIALIKDSSLVSVLGVAVLDRELLRVGRDAAATTGLAAPLVAAGLLYLAVTVPLTRVVNRLERGVRAPS